ncbi:hypothetical protein [Actinomadura chokoriensis]|uniref:Aminoacyl-transfer RNA synthetases class-II family profile domain-containing protein n=1 Tax=Actinomadura chokoriensis TaxID=454156 RepID=A0ABV4QXB5_9ACTN
MFETRIALESPLPCGYRPEIERRIYFVSAQITDFRLIERDDLISEIVVVTDRPANGEELAEKVRFVLDHDLSGHRVVTPDVMWTSSGRRAADERTYADLTERSLVLETGEGQVAVGQPLIALMDYFDDAVTSMALTMFDASEFRYPTLIPTGVLDRCGYLASFPQHLMLTTRLHNDVDAYQRFKAEYERRGTVDRALLDWCESVDYCLPPTMCFHTFNQYSGQRLASDGPLVVTARGKSFRFESRYAKTLERLWDFTIREIVFIGRKADVLAGRTNYMRAVQRFAEKLELSGVCVVGNDPFFLSESPAGQAWSQQLMELKYELRLHVATRRDIAVASFNYHEDFFGRRFGIALPDGARAHSSCVGVGLERLTYAFLCQYGTDPDGWPAEVAAAVAGSRRSLLGERA